MTKVRPPLSIDAALSRIAGRLPGGWADMAAICQRAERTVRNWGDPDTPESIPFDCQLALDLAYRAAGGMGAPIYEAYTVQLELAGADRFAQPQAIARLLPDLIRECSEAELSVALAALPGASARDRQAASQEIDQAIAKLNQARLVVQSDPDETQHPSTGPPLVAAQP